MIRDPKGREWRDHAIIPWVDAERLTAATERAMAANKLTQEEATRNTLMSGRVFKFTRGATVQNTSTLPNLLPSRAVRCSSRSFAPMAFPDGRFHPLVPKGCHTGAVRPPPAYPTLRFLKATFALKAVGVKVLHSPSRLESMVVSLSAGGAAALEAAKGSEAERKVLARAAADPLRAAANASAIAGDVRRARAESLARQLVGKHCFLGYPYASGGRVVAVMDNEGAWRLSRRGELNKAPLGKPWPSIVAEVQKRHLTLHGMDVGPVDVLVEAEPVAGMVQTLDGGSAAEYDKNTTLTPVQAIPSQAPQSDPRFVPQAAPPLGQRFQKGDRVIYLGESNYGQLATVTNKKKGNDGKVKSFSLRLRSVRSAQQETNAARVARETSSSMRDT